MAERIEDLPGAGQFGRRICCPTKGGSTPSTWSARICIAGAPPRPGWGPGSGTLHILAPSARPCFACPPSDKAPLAGSKLPSCRPWPARSSHTWRSRLTGSCGEPAAYPWPPSSPSVAVVILLLDLNAALILCLWVLRTIVLYVVIAFFITLLFTPATRFMKRRLHMSHGGAVLLVFLLGLHRLRRSGLPVRRAAGDQRRCTSATSSPT